jgi:tripartite-type tricarboxylate transporter receptor subunit TctC
VRAQRLRALAVTSGERSQQLPLLPTVDESGLRGYKAITWSGMLAPAKTPPEIVHRLSQALQQVIRSNEMRAQFQRQGTEAASGEPAVFATLIRQEMEMYAKLAKISGIKVD